MQHLSTTAATLRRTTRISSAQVGLEGELSVPANAAGVVLFAHVQTMEVIRDAS